MVSKAVAELGRKPNPIYKKKYQPKHRKDGTFKKPKLGKYNSRGIRLDGRFFHSESEAGRYLQLKLLETEKKSKAEQDYYQFVLDELEKAALVEGEQEELEQQQEVLAHAGEIKSCLLRSIQELSGDEGSLLSMLSGIISALSGRWNDLRIAVTFFDSGM